MTKKQAAFNTDWFKLENYDKLKTNRGIIEDLKLWRRQLLIRQYIKNKLDGRPEWDDSQRKYARQHVINEWLPFIKTNPVLGDEFEDCILTQTRGGQRFSSASFDQRTVYSTPADYIYDFDNRHHTRLREKASLTIKQKLHDGVIKKPKGWVCLDAFIDSLPIDYHRFEAGCDERGRFTNVTVNLTATDGQIKEDFEKWLKAYRKATGYMPNEKLRGDATTKKSPKFNEKEIKEWFDLKLLPYIDLCLMAKAQGAEPTNTQMAELLFPEEYEAYLNNENEGDEEERFIKNLANKIRQTKKTKADALLTDEILTAINLQLNS